MITITKVALDRLHVDLQASLDAEAMGQAFMGVVHAVREAPVKRVMFRLHDFSEGSLRTLEATFGSVPKLFTLAGSYQKCAVCTDLDRLRRAAIVEGAMTPGLDVHAFGLSEHQKAEAWLAA